MEALFFTIDCVCDARTQKIFKSKLIINLSYLYFAVSLNVSKT